MKLHFVDTMDQVLQIALESPLPTLREEEEAVQPIAPPLSSGTGDSPAAHQ
jgi:ATP-dependent Lon protease